MQGEGSHRLHRVLTEPKGCSGMERKGRQGNMQRCICCAVSTSIFLVLEKVKSSGYLEPLQNLYAWPLHLLCIPKEVNSRHRLPAGWDSA